MNSSKKPTLYIVSTPIGNLGDITYRAVEVLNFVDVIVCEDTRVTSSLLKNFGISKPLYMHHDFSKDYEIAKIINLLKSGKSVALVSDAGTPIISDPGYKLVQLCLAEKIEVTACPGPSSAINAMVLSGLPVNQFFFIGFMPEKAASRYEIYKKVKTIAATSIIFSSARDVSSLIDELQSHLGDVLIVIAREMTKFYEEIIRGKASELKLLIANKPLKGELVVLIEPLLYKNDRNKLQEVASILLDSVSVKTSAELLSKIFPGSNKNENYKICLDLAKKTK
jgi:16S rRNA (cytidine1402-2'-O)-methyltransferase